MCAVRKYGFHVTGVTDGATALKRWQLNQRDLVAQLNSAVGVPIIHLCLDRSPLARCLALR